MNLVLSSTDEIPPNSDAFACAHVHFQKVVYVALERFIVSDEVEENPPKCHNLWKLLHAVSVECLQSLPLRISEAVKVANKKKESATLDAIATIMCAIKAQRGRAWVRIKAGCKEAVAERQTASVMRFGSKGARGKPRRT